MIQEGYTNMIKKLGILLLACSFICQPLGLADRMTIDQHKGLQLNPKADKIDDFAYSRFDNVYIKDKNVQSVKGRDKLNTSANADTTVNMFCFYENSDGTRKLVIREADEVVTYDLDATGRTSILGSLTDESGNCIQVGNNLYFSSPTDGLKKWTGSGSASSVAGVSIPGTAGLTSSVGGLLDANAVYQYRFVRTNTKYGIQSEAGGVFGNQLNPGHNSFFMGSVGTASPFNGLDLYRSVGFPSGSSAAGFFRAVVGMTGPVTDGLADNDLGIALDTTIDTITPPSFEHIGSYKGALFLAEDFTINFTHLPVDLTTNADQYWLDTDKFTLSSAETITGLKNTSNSLVIFTHQNIHEITGFGFETFRLTTLAQGIGATANATIVVDSQGDIIFFAGVQGVYKLRTFQQPSDDLTGSVIDQDRIGLIRISSPHLNDVFRGTDSSINLDPANYSVSSAYYDFDNDLYFLYIDEHCFVFDNQNQTWSHIPAVKTIASLYRRSVNESGQGVLLDDIGFIYNNWLGYENSIESGTVTGTPTSTTSTTLTDTGATFNTTGDGLAGTWVFVDNENKEYRQITSNTATAITVASAWTTNPITSDNYYIGYIVNDFTTKQYQFTPLPDTTTVSAFWLLHNRSDASQNIDLYVFKNKETIAERATDIIDLTTNLIDKIGMQIKNAWIQWRFRSFIYNTSDTINPPIDIVAYSLDFEPKEAR